MTGIDTRGLDRERRLLAQVSGGKTCLIYLPARRAARVDPAVALRADV